MSRVKVIKKTNKSEDAKELSDLFNQLSDSADSDPEILVPMTTKLINAVYQSLLVLKIINEFGLIVSEFPALELSNEMLTKFLKKSEEETKIKSKSTEEKMAGLDSKEINTIFRKLRDSETVKKLTVTGGILQKFKKEIEADDSSFIKSELEFKPFPSYFPIDVALLWKMEETPKLKQIKNVLFLSIKKMMISTFDVYDISTSPTVNVEKFSDLLVEQLTQLKKEIPRCDKAFDAIKNSSRMLKKNFKSYYRMGLEAGNRNLVAEFFISDLLKGPGAKSPVIKFQLTKIGNYLREKAKKYSDVNPQIKKTMDFLGKMQEKMEKVKFDASEEPEEETPEPPKDKPEPEEETPEPEEETLEPEPPKNKPEPAFS